MNVTATKEDIEQSAALLDLLQRWGKLKEIHGDYNRGFVTFGVDGNVGRETLTIGVDAFSHRQVPIAEKPATKAQREIDTLVGKTAEKLAGEICEIIKRNMPIPLE